MNQVAQSEKNLLLTSFILITILVLMAVGGYTLFDYLKKIDKAVMPSDIGTTTETTTKAIDDTSTLHSKPEHWAKDAKATISSSGTQITWAIRVQKESSQIRASGQNLPATGAVVTVEFRGGQTTQLTGTVGSDGWVSWTRAIPKVATGLYIVSIVGELPWSANNQALWKDRAVASYKPAY